MSDSMTRKQTDNLPTADEVITYIKKNPGFLQQHPEVLDILLPPTEKQGKGVIDFQYYMVRQLRADRDEVVETTREIVETSRANMNNQARFHTAVLMLLEARSFEDFIRTITLDLAAVLDVDIISVVVETDGDSIPHIELSGVRAVKPGTIDLLMKKKSVMLEAFITGFDDIYGGGSTLVKSQALLRLTVAQGTPPVLLAFGSRNPDLFVEGQGTELLVFLGRVIERCFRDWLHLS
jgi:uncharacterized protein YigA (DUF484 family)